VILHCTFEELAALSAGAERVLADAGGAGVAVAAPPEIVSELETLTPRLIGDLTVSTLAEQRRIARAISFVLGDLKTRMDSSIVLEHAASESAVQAYFEYAHVLSIEDKLRRLGSQMSAMIELMTGAPATDEVARDTAFPD
jgi:hypothetical protein